MDRPPDFVESLGALTLAHRLKRLMQTLLEEVERTHETAGLPIKARWISTLLLLEREGPLGVSEVAGRLRLSHPAVVQSLDDMSGLGLVSKRRDPGDGRRTVLSLSAKGRRWMPRLRATWGELERAQERVFADAGVDVLEVVERMEAALEANSISDLVHEGLTSKGGTDRRRTRSRTLATRRP